jgi:hypothetical protein
MMPNYSRLIPESKSVHMMIYNPIYGWAVIDSRATGDVTNPPLPVLPTPLPPPVVALPK